MTLVLRFDLERDGCCQVCNPPSLADLERLCVRVQLGDVSRYICLDCLQDMQRAAAGTPVVKALDPEVQQFWADVRTTRARDGVCGRCGHARRYHETPGGECIATIATDDHAFCQCSSFVVPS